MICESLKRKEGKEGIDGFGLIVYTGGRVGMMV